MEDDQTSRPIEKRDSQKEEEKEMPEVQTETIPNGVIENPKRSFTVNGEEFECAYVSILDL